MDGALARFGPGARTGVPALADDPDLLVLVLDAAPVGFACFDTSLRYLHVNRRLAELDGLAAEDHVGRTAQQVSPGIAAAVDAQLRAVLRTGRPVEGVEVAGEVDGVTGRWTTSWYPVREPHSGRVRGVAGVVTEVGVTAREQVRETALTLQRSLLPSSTPSTEALEVAVRYDAGVADTDVGGDWYDVIPLGGGRTAIVIGDVMGRGVHAAAVMGQLRTAVRTCARLDLRPVEVLELLDGLVGDLDGADEGSIATCVYAVFDPHTRELLLASAGHLPPVLRTAAGEAHRLELEVSPPLGIGHAASQSRIRLEPGYVLALYTDGLVEVHGSDIDAGLDALCRVLAAGPEDLEELADSVLHKLSTDDADDDVALVLVRVPLDVDSRSHTVVLPVPRERAQLVDVRAQARTAMQGWALLEDVVHTGTVLVTELLTNALVHGKGSVELRLRVTRDRLLVEAEDGGSHLPRRRHAGHDDEYGRGLHLVATLSDRWGTRLTDDGKVVWAELSLA